MDNPIILMLVLGLILLLGGIWYYLSHAKTSTKKIEHSGIDLKKLVASLGGIDNLQEVSASGSKVIFTLETLQGVDNEALKQLGASGIVASKNRLTLIFGKASEALVKELKAEIGDR